MTLRMIDGFDHYSTNADLSAKWNSCTTSTAPSTTAGRRGGGCYQGTSGILTKSFDSQQTWIIGFAFKMQGGLPLSPVNILAINDGSTNQIALRVDAAGKLIILRNGTTLATSTNAMNSAAFFYIEVKTKIDPTVGTYDVHVNGTSWLSGSGANTRSSSNSSADNIQLGPNSSVWSSPGVYIDDVYICDAQGSTNNDFLGDVRVDAYFPSAAGNTTQLTASSGSNYAAVNENPENGDTSYVQSATSGQKDTYAFQDMTHTPTAIYGVMINMWAKKDDAGNRAICSVIRSGGADTDGTTQYLSTSYYDLLQIRETDPNTSAAWTKTNFNAAEFGVKVAA